MKLNTIQAVSECLKKNEIFLYKNCDVFDGDDTSHGYGFMGSGKKYIGCLNRWDILNCINDIVY